MDSQAEFDRKTKAMFDRVRANYEEIAIRFVVRIMEHVVQKTPGIDNFEPADTEYQHTGRLRGGYRVSASRLAVAANWDDGPYSYYGVETVQRIEAEMRAQGAKSCYIVNDVAYAYIVREGLGRHLRPRDFLEDTGPATQRAILREVLSGMGRP